MPTESRPNFFIVGAQKSGTSGIAGWLGQHPQVFMSFPKEPGYLAFMGAGYPYPDGRGRSAPASEYVVRDERDYLNLFANTSKEHLVLGEASTWYFAVRGVAQRIREFNPEARILVILRNPVDRAYSAWCHARRDDLEPCEEFEEALDLEQERGEVEFLLRYHRMGMYSESLAEYQALFDPSHLKVLLYEDLQGDREPLWHQLCTFLEIDPLDEVPPQRRLNRSGQPRLRLLQSLMKSHRFRSTVTSIIPRSKAAPIKAALDSANLRRFPPMDNGARLRLQRYYRQDIEAISRLLGRDLSSWLI